MRALVLALSILLCGCIVVPLSPQIGTDPTYPESRASNGWKTQKFSSGSHTYIAFGLSAVHDPDCQCQRPIDPTR